MEDRPNLISIEYWVKINIKKTKAMKISRKEETIVLLRINGEEIEQMRNFCY